MTLFIRIADGVALRLECSDALADLELHCLHMSLSRPHDATHIEGLVQDFTGEGKN